MNKTLVKSLSLFFTVIFFSLSSLYAFSGDCVISTEPDELFIAEREFHYSWLIPNKHIFWSKKLPENDEYWQFREWVLPKFNIDPIEGLEELRELLLDQYGDDAFQVENVDKILGGEVGVIRPAYCLEALLLGMHLQNFSFMEEVSEFSAYVLENKENDGSLELKIYFSSFKLPSRMPDFIKEMISSDVDAGWRLKAHLHNHPFLIDTPGYSGPLVPSPNDILLWRGLSEESQLARGIITNGFDTLELDQNEFYNLRTSESDI